MVKLSDPVGSNPVATRAAIISDVDFKSYMAMDSGSAETDEEEEEEEDDE